MTEEEKLRDVIETVYTLLGRNDGTLADYRGCNWQAMEMIKVNCPWVVRK